MSTPVPRPQQPAAVPGPQETAAQVSMQRPDQGRDIGWVITLIGAAGALLGSWTLFPNEGDAGGNGMWAGYWTSLFGTIAVVGAAWLRSSVAPLTAAVVTGLAGLALILTGALHDYETVIQVPMIAGGVAIALGAVMQATGRD